MTMTSLGLALLAGLLSTLSPCVLPLLPIVLGTAATEHRLGPVALAVGLALSFVLIGLFVATIGFAAGFDAEVFRKLAAVIMLIIGVVLMVPSLQDRLATAAGPVGGWASRRMERMSRTGLRGQFAVGTLLGAVWSPCVGPTLGAASVLAAQGQALPQVALTMLMFGIGAAIPLLIIGTLSREALMAVRGRLLTAGSTLKKVLGLTLAVVGLSVLTGIDKTIEAQLVAWSPAWLTELTTRF